MRNRATEVQAIRRLLLAGGAMKGVLRALHDHADEEGCCDVRIPRIARETCYTEKTVGTAIEHLIKRKLIEAERRGTSSVYWLDWSRILSTVEDDQ